MLILCSRVPLSPVCVYFAPTGLGLVPTLSRAVDKPQLLNSRTEESETISPTTSSKHPPVTIVSEAWMRNKSTRPTKIHRTVSNPPIQNTQLTNPTQIPEIGFLKPITVTRRKSPKSHRDTVGTH
uniref:Uncharacterized protein n=1 Tax=Ananas comosus var. bracteatus TaxID=296719 RepID=A0A6V7QLG5_ANACO|nr:unnamed protein product [Ananas comosus var. bracteatus]